MPGDRKNLPASVHQRLLDMARASSRPFNELLQRYAMERFIYRLSRSPESDRFILKGALMFPAWRGDATRPTMDIDLEGKIANEPNMIATAIRNACTMKVEADGMSFSPASVKAERIMEEAGYSGVRARLRGNLGNARIALQIDVGFGDPIVPGPRKITCPALLDFPPPVMWGYSMESAIAEKFHAMVRLGVINSRMKDFYDIWFLSRSFDFNGAILAEAIEKTFAGRATPIPQAPAVFDPAFAKDRDKAVQWRGFIEKSRLAGAPGTFAAAAGIVAKFIQPVAAALQEHRRFKSVWKAPGPWR